MPPDKPPTTEPAPDSSPSRPVPTATVSEPAPGSSTSTTTTAAKESDPRTQGMSFVDLLRARSEATVEKPIAQAPEGQLPDGWMRGKDVPVKPRKPLMARKLYPISPAVQTGTGMMLKVLINEVLPGMRN